MGRIYEPPFILALDVGSSSVRAMLFDSQGRGVDGKWSVRAIAFDTGVDGSSSIRAELILEKLFDCIDEVLVKSAAEAADLAGVAVCTFVSNILGVDAQGRPLTPVTTYADVSSRPEADELRRDLDHEYFRQRTGCYFHPSYLPSRFIRMQRRQPELFDCVAKWITIGEYLELTLFGRKAVSVSVASWSGLLNRHTLGWDSELLELLPVRRDQLASLTDINEPRRGLRSIYARRWPGLKDVPWFPALGDGAAANVGSGCTSPDRVSLTLGTSGALRIVYNKPIETLPSGLWCYRVDAQRSLPGSAVSEGGCVHAWLRRTLQLESVSLDLEELEALEPDTHGLTILPFWAGERGPGWSGRNGAVIYGLHLGSTPPQLLRAGLEAVAYRLASIYDCLTPLLPAGHRIIAGGGALFSSRLWPQIIADVFGREIVLTQVEQASARGAALLALEALGYAKRLEALAPGAEKQFVPDKDAHERYVCARQRQEKLYGLLAEM